MSGLSRLLDSPTGKGLVGVAAVAAAGGSALLLWRYVRKQPHRLSAAAPTGDDVVSTTSSGHDGRVYETDKAVQEYLLFHFGADRDILPYGSDIAPTSALHFAERTADRAMELWFREAGAGAPAPRAFDVGCAVGGSAFALSAQCASVLGLDFSHRFVETAEQLRRGASLPYRFTVEGDITASATATAPAEAKCSRIRFVQGDACNLPSAEDLGGPFHIVHAANLLCRLPDPMRFLSRLPALTTADALVVFISPFSWLPQYTPKDKWLGGTVSAGSAVHSRDTLVSVMADLGFKLVHEEDTPFLIREHARKFQWGCSRLTAFKRGLTSPGLADQKDVV